VLIYLFLIRELISLKILSTIHFLAFSLHENFLGVLLKQLIKMSPRDLFLMLCYPAAAQSGTKKISPLFHTLLSLFSRTQNFVSRTSPSRQQALVLISSSIARRALIATPWSPSSLAPKPWLSGAQSLSCLGRRSQPLAGFPAHPISPWNQATRCAQPSRSISLASSSPVRECAPSIPVPKCNHSQGFSDDEHRSRYSPSHEVLCLQKSRVATRKENLSTLSRSGRSRPI
jgi:hypothetical protein